jgi:hypothetical protein
VAGSSTNLMTLKESDGSFPFLRKSQIRPHPNTVKYTYIHTLNNYPKYYLFFVICCLFSDVFNRADYAMHRPKTGLLIKELKNTEGSGRGLI